MVLLYARVGGQRLQPGPTVSTRAWWRSDILMYWFAAPSTVTSDTGELASIFVAPRFWIFSWPTSQATHFWTRMVSAVQCCRSGTIIHLPFCWVDWQVMFLRAWSCGRHFRRHRTKVANDMTRSTTEQSNLVRLTGLPISASPECTCE